MSAVRSRALLAALILGLLAVSHRPLAADEAAKPAAGGVKGTSVGLVPADASFYTSGLRWREQVDLFTRSRAYKALRALPSVKKLEAEVMGKLKEDGPAKMVQGFFRSPLGKDLVEIATEAVSEETFVYGGAAWNDFFKLLAAINQAQTAGTYGALFSGGDPNTGQGRAILRALTKNKGMIKIPDLVIGFKVATPKRAEKRLAEIGKIVELFTGGVKELEDKLTTKKVAGGDFLTLELDGSQVPWDTIPLADLEEKKGEFDGLVADLKKKKFTAAVGVTGGYLLLSLGETTKGLESLFAKGGKKLIDHDALKAVRDAGDKRFTSLGYVSKEFMESAGGNAAAQYGDLVRTMKEALKGADLKDERKKAIAKELDELADHMKGHKVEFGPSVGYSYLTDTGYEAYAHDMTNHPGLDKVKFKLHDHFGGEPIFAAAFGFTVDGSVYTNLVKFGKKAFEQGEGVFLDSADANSADEYKKAKAALVPILEKLDRTTSKLLLPSMAQSGVGIVIDGKWKSKQWVMMAPATEKEMPMLELGLLVGTSDGKKFVEAMKEYRLTLNELFEKASEFPGGPPPGFKIPAAESGEGLYWWPIPDSVLDKQFQPTVGTGKAAAVLALSKSHAGRLTKPTPLKFRDKALAIDGEVLGCCVLDWVGFIDLVTPWVEFSVEHAAKDFAADEKKGKQWAKEAKTALMIFKSFKGSTSTTKKADVGVIHKTVIVVKDIDAMPDPIE